MTNELLTAYKETVLAKEIPDGKIEEIDGNIEISTSYALGKINFYDMDIVIVEMSVINLADDENKFYLHFELRDLAYAEELFAEMIQTLLDLKNKQSLKILLSCTGGLTTGFFADKLNETAKVLELDYEFNAMPFPRLYEVAADYDVILLAPQIAYQAKNVHEVLHDKLVLQVPPKVFASYDGAEMIKFINEELEKWHQTVEERAIAKVRAGLVNSNAKILSIAVMPDRDQTRIAYRIYEEGTPILDETVIKGRLNVIRDLQDILDTLPCRVKYDTVGVAIAGIVHDGGYLDLPSYMDPDVNLQKLLEDKYKVPVTVTNNLKAAALGYYAQQDKYKNILFLSRPFGFKSSGMGVVLDGKIFNGSHNIAGEIRFMIPSVMTEEEYHEYKMTDLDKVFKYVAIEIRAGIAMIDPEVVCIRSAMTPDVDKLREAVKEYMPEKYLPDFVYMRDEELAEYILLGQMIVSLEELERRK